MTKTLYKNIESHFINKDQFSNKKDYGKLLIYGGSSFFKGAPIISSLAALRSGVGYVSLLKTKENDFNEAPNEVIFEIIKGDNFDINIFNKYNTILFGNGLVNSKYNQDLLIFLIKNYKKNLVIDATGIDILKSILDLKLITAQSNKDITILLTPHIDEFKRFLNITSDSKNVVDFVYYANKISKNKNYVLLKGYDCLISNNNKNKVIKGRIPALAKAGSGDALAGLISGLLCYSLLSLPAIVELAYQILLISAKSLSYENAQSSLIISDIINNIPKSVYLFYKQQSSKLNFIKRKKF